MIPRIPDRIFTELRHKKRKPPGNHRTEDTVTAKVDVVDMQKEDSYHIYCDMDILKQYLKRQAAGGRLIGQPD